VKPSPSHTARKLLFQRGIRQGSLTVREIEQALLPGSLNEAERWLLYYSLHASGIAILDDDGVRLRTADIPPSPG
jgi:hypothetical protein